MKVNVTKKTPEQTIAIVTEFIKLQDAMKLAAMVGTGGEAKTAIQDGQVKVNGEVCAMRGKKLRPGDAFTYQGRTCRVSAGS